MSAKQAISDKLQGSVATYLRCGRVVNNQIKKKFINESVSENIFFKSLNIWQRTWLSHALVCLANTLLKDGETARQTVNSRQPSLCSSTHLHTLPTDAVAANPLSTFRWLLKHFYSSNHILTSSSEWPLQWVHHMGHLTNLLCNKLLPHWYAASGLFPVGSTSSMFPSSVP